MKKAVVLLAVAVTAAVAQPALADGHGFHRWGRGGNGWVPFAAGAVIGGIAVGAMMQPQPVYAQPVYMGPPPPRLVVQRPYYGPPPVYVIPAPNPGYYYDRD